jgi:hypothetical protein
MASDVATGASAPPAKGTLRQQQMSEQRAIANASLTDENKHLAVNTNPKPVPLTLPEYDGTDAFGKNDNNRRAYERLKAQKGSASGPKLRPLGTISVSPDAEVSDSINPTVGEKAHNEDDVAIAQATQTAVINKEPVDPIKRAGSKGNATGDPKVDDALQGKSGPQTPAAAGAPQATGWQRNA